MILHFFTIVKDGQPFISLHYPVLRQLSHDWTWTVVEGTAAPEADTSWVAPSTPGLSADGTTEYLESLCAFDRRVRHLKGAWWHGKAAMCNAACELIQEPGLLWQIDADELWTADQIGLMAQMFISDKKKNAARFFCRYFVGPDIAITSRNGYGNHPQYEWNRVWRVQPGIRFKTHEPPCLENFEERPFHHKETEKAGLVFDHLAYATEKQVAFKAEYYGSPNNKKGELYKGALAGWTRLQENNKWPVTDLSEFMPWVGKNVIANRI